MLKKHSTSSEVLALGCSGLSPVLALSRRRHSLPSILVMTATSVSRENPRMVLIGLNIYNMQIRVIVEKYLSDYSTLLLV